LNCLVAVFFGAVTLASCVRDAGDMFVLVPKRVFVGERDEGGFMLRLKREAMLAN
jgi:hypothetical protein